MAESRDDYMSAVTIGPRRRVDGPIVLADYDPAWPVLYEREASRVRGVLGERVLLLEHVGSTSVPGLPAKPIVDILLAVPDSADETAYVPPMEAAGYVLRIREPDWHEHRAVQGSRTRTSTCTPSATDRRRSCGCSPSATGCGPTTTSATCTCGRSASWPPATGTYVQDYADAKGEVVEAIIARALAGSADADAR